MIVLIAALMWAMKCVVVVEHNASSQTRLPWWNWLAFATLWFGMRPGLFQTISFKPRTGWSRPIVRGLLRIGLGSMMIFAARVIFRGHDGMLTDWQTWVSTVLLLVGLSLVIHFGLFNLLTGFWRLAGVNCQPLFRAPLASCSLGEFWGKRWNLAFSEMTAIAVFRPLKHRFGNGPYASAVATSIAFVFSGLLHEIAISVPVRTGYGLPMLYFAIHGIGMAIEAKLRRTPNSCLASKIGGRLWTAIWVLAPLPMLFHRPFLEGCIWPFLEQ